MGDRLLVAQALSIGEYGRLTHYDATAGFESRLEVCAGTLNVSTSGAINVDARGFPGGNRHGHGESWGQTTNHAAGSTYRSGGSYGGLGYSVGGVPNPIYGNTNQPAELGSGGSYDAGAAPGGDGGGWVCIHAGSVTVDGVISAGGGNGQGNDAGSGSGGTIYIETGALDGVGTLRANGGGYQVPGGGGRIALKYPAAASDTNDLTLSVAGGIAGGRVAGNGTTQLDGGYVYIPISLSTSLGGANSAEGSRPLILLLHTVGADVAELRWADGAAGSASVYTVEFSPDLHGANWIALPGTISGNRWIGELPGHPRRGFIRMRRQ
jgi:hypothetical protein